MMDREIGMEEGTGMPNMAQKEIQETGVCVCVNQSVKHQKPCMVACGVTD